MKIAVFERLSAAVILRRAGHQAGLQADVAVAHLALDLRAGDERGDQSMTTMSSAP